MALGFIRYFASTDDSAMGKAALGYLPSLLRIAPVRVVSKSGQLEGPWRRYDSLIMTPMAGECVSCVCTPPSQWIWEVAVPMPSKNVGPGEAALDTMPKVWDRMIGGTARGVVELYTPKVRNVLFVVEPPVTDSQRQTAARYEAVLWATEDAVARSGMMPAAKPGGDLAAGAYTDFVYQTLDHSKVDHAVIRAAVLGEPPTSDIPYR